MKRPTNMLIAVLVLGLLAAVPRGACARPDTTLSVYAKWTDRLGGTHPLKKTRLEFWDDNYPLGGSDTHLGTIYTDTDGYASCTTDRDDWGSEIEFYVQHVAGAEDVARVCSTFGWGGYQQRRPTSANYEVTEGGTDAWTMLPMSNASYPGSSFSILQNLVFMNDYYTNVRGMNLPFVYVQYDGTIRDTSSYSPTAGPDADPVIRIARQDWAAWDVIGHEYGHHVIQQAGMRGNHPGGLAHSSGVDNIAAQGQGYGIANGTSLAWNEGMATVAWLLAVKEHNLAGYFGGPALPTYDTDTWYDPFDSTSEFVGGDGDLDFRHDIESLGFLARTGGLLNRLQQLPLTIARGRGEGDEMSARRAVWDFYDPRGEAYTGRTMLQSGDQAVNPIPTPIGYTRFGTSDKAYFDAAETWDAMTNSTTFRGFWRGGLTPKLNTDAGKAAMGLPRTATRAEATARAGEILEENGIAAIPRGFWDGITDGTITTDTTPTLSFTEQNFSNSTHYRLLLYSFDWANIEYDSGNILDTTLNTIDDRVHMIPNADALAVGDYWFVALSSPAASGLAQLNSIYSDYYWSGALWLQVRGVPTPGAICLGVLGAMLVVRRRRRA